jgi:hypothetical protein
VETVGRFDITDVTEREQYFYERVGARDMLDMTWPRLFCMSFDAKEGLKPEFYHAQRALSGFVYQISAEYKISMSSIFKIPGIVAYSVQIPDVPIRFSIHGTGQCPL